MMFCCWVLALGGDGFGLGFEESAAYGSLVFPGLCHDPGTWNPFAGDFARKWNCSLRLQHRVIPNHTALS
jgi:hypothetical protein